MIKNYNKYNDYNIITRFQNKIKNLFYLYRIFKFNGKRRIQIQFLKFFQ
jgi:hypothetical protein